MAYGELLQSQKSILRQYVIDHPDVTGIDDVPYDVYSEAESKKESEYFHTSANNYIQEVSDEISTSKWGEAKHISHGENRKGGYKRFYAAEKEGWECPLCHVILGDGDVEPYDHIKIHSAATEGDSEDHSHQWVGTPAVCEICGRSWKGIQTELSPNGGWREAKATEGLYEDYISTFGDSSSLGGGFGDALQNGDLCEAWTRADLENRERLKTITGRTEEDLNDSCYDNKPNYFGDESKATEDHAQDMSDMRSWSQSLSGEDWDRVEQAIGTNTKDSDKVWEYWFNNVKVGESKATEGGWCNKCQRDTGQGWSYSNKTSHMKRVHPEVPRSEWNSLDYWGSAVGGADNYIGDDAAKTYYEPGGRFEQEMGRTVNESKARENVEDMEVVGTDWSIQQDDHGVGYNRVLLCNICGYTVNIVNKESAEREANQHTQEHYAGKHEPQPEPYGIDIGESKASEYQVMCPNCSKTYDTLADDGKCEYCGQDNSEFYGDGSDIKGSQDSQGGYFGDRKGGAPRINESKATEYSIQEEYDLQDEDGKWEMLTKADVPSSYLYNTNEFVYGYDSLPQNVKSQLHAAFGKDIDGGTGFGESWTEEDEQDYRDEQNFDPPFPEEEEANEDLTPKDIEDYYASQDKDVGEDDQELLDFYASMSQEGHTEIADDDEIINWINTKPSDINLDSSDIMDRYDITRDEAFKLIDKANSIKYGEEVDFSTKHLGGNPNADSSEDEILNWINNDHLTGEPSDQFEDDVGSGRSIVNSLFDRHSLDHMINESEAGELITEDDWMNPDFPEQQSTDKQKSMYKQSGMPLQRDGEPDMDNFEENERWYEELSSINDYTTDGVNLWDHDTLEPVEYDDSVRDDLSYGRSPNYESKATEAEVVCPECQGTGLFDLGDLTKICPNCDGEGKIDNTPLSEWDEKKYGPHGETKAGEYEVDIQDGVAEEDLEDNAGLNTSDNQAGNVFNCPSCGFKTHNRDEYDVHNDTHGNVPATVKTPLSEENIAVQNNDYQLLSRFKQ